MPMIECGGQGEYAKGRNGYYDLKAVSVDNMTNPAASAVSIHFHSSKSAWPHSGYARLTPEHAAQVGQALIDEARKLMPTTK